MEKLEQEKEIIEKYIALLTEEKNTIEQHLADSEIHKSVQSIYNRIKTKDITDEEREDILKNRISNLDLHKKLTKLLYAEEQELEKINEQLAETN